MIENPILAESPTGIEETFAFNKGSGALFPISSDSDLSVDTFLERSDIISYSSSSSHINAEAVCCREYTNFVLCI